MRQEMMGFWGAVASAGLYANNVHLAPDRSPTNTPLLNFYRPNALPDAQPTVAYLPGIDTNVQSDTFLLGLIFGLILPVDNYC